MKKIYTLMLVAVAACLFVSCNSVEHKMKKLSKLRLEQEELNVELAEIYHKVNKTLIGLENADDIEDAIEDFEDYLEDAMEEKEDELEKLNKEIKRKQERLGELHTKASERYLKLENDDKGRGNRRSDNDYYGSSY